MSLLLSPKRLLQISLRATNAQPPLLSAHCNMHNAEPCRPHLPCWFHEKRTASSSTIRPAQPPATTTVCTLCRYRKCTAVAAQPALSPEVWLSPKLSAGATTLVRRQHFELQRDAVPPRRPTRSQHPACPTCLAAAHSLCTLAPYHTLNTPLPHHALPYEALDDVDITSCFVHAVSWAYLWSSCSRLPEGSQDHALHSFSSGRRKCP